MLYYFILNYVLKTWGNDLRALLILFDECKFQNNSKTTEKNVGHNINHALILVTTPISKTNQKSSLPLQLYNVTKCIAFKRKQKKKPKLFRE